MGCPNYFTAYAALHDDVESNVAKQQAVDVLAESLREDSPDLAPEVFAEATAKEIYEYALYKYNHDSRYQKSLAPNSTTMSQLRALASEQAFYSNQSASPAITELATLPGRTLAAFVVGQFQSLIVAAKQLSPQFPQHKLTLLFGSSAPIIDFFMLSQLSSSSLTSRQFSSLPERGSVMGFELFTPDQPNGTVLPESFTPRNLLVRFVWRNGTDEDAPMRAYPLFGRGNSQTEIPWTDFVSSIETFSMTRVQRWCRICDSMSVFCKGTSFFENTALVG